MGLRRKKVAGFCLLLLLLFLLQTPFSASVTHAARHGGVKPNPAAATASKSSHHPDDQFQEFVGGSGGERDHDGADPIFGDEKRKVRTGPNPLHNR